MISCCDSDIFVFCYSSEAPTPFPSSSPTDAIEQCEEVIRCDTQLPNIDPIEGVKVCVDVGGRFFEICVDEDNLGFFLPENTCGLCPTDSPTVAPTPVPSPAPTTSPTNAPVEGTPDPTPGPTESPTAEETPEPSPNTDSLGSAQTTDEKSSGIPTHPVEIIEQMSGWLVPFLIASVISVWFTIERMVVLRRSRVIPRSFAEPFLENLHKGKLDSATAISQCHKPYGSPGLLDF